MNIEVAEKLEAVERHARVYASFIEGVKPVYGYVTTIDLPEDKVGKVRTLNSMRLALDHLVGPSVRPSGCVFGWVMSNGKGYIVGERENAEWHSWSLGCNDVE